LLEPSRLSFGPEKAEKVSVTFASINPISTTKFAEAVGSLPNTTLTNVIPGILG